MNSEEFGERDCGAIAMMRKYPEYAEMMDVGAKWAALMPDSAWTLGLPPKVRELGVFVAVKTQTGEILTGTLRTFSKLYNRNAIARSSRYGPIVAWLIFGEPS